MKSRRQSSRVWVGTGVLAALVIVAVAWFLLISPIRADAQGLRDDTASVATGNVALEAKVAQLQQQAKHKTQLAADLRKALAGLPPGTKLPVFSRQLASQAVGRGVELTSVSIASPTTPSTTDQTTVPATGQTVVAVPVTVQSTGPALQELYFLRDIQQIGPRLALVTSISLAPAPAAEAPAGSTTTTTTPETPSIDAAATMTVQLTVFTNPLPKAARTQLAKVLGDDKL